MWNKTLSFCIFSLLCLASFDVFGESSDHNSQSSDPGPLVRRTGENSSLSLDQLKSNVRAAQNAGTAAWWKSVEDLLNKLSPTEAAAFAGEITDGKGQALFRNADKARQSDAKVLKEMLKKVGGDSSREAAAKEIERRLQDPTLQFIAEHFATRPERALEFAEALKKAAGDPKKLAQILARHIGPLNRAQRDKLLAAAEGAKTEGLDRELIAKIAEAARVSVGGLTDNQFKKDFKEAYDGVLQRNRDFDQLLSNALSGDEASRTQLIKQFGKEAVLDFISAKMKNGEDGLAVDLAKAVARKDSEGNLFLDLDPDNAALASDAKGQMLFLGNQSANDNIRAALDAFEQSQGTGHDDGTSFDPKTSGRLQQATLGSGPNDSRRKVFASRGADGKPTLTEIPEGQGLPKELATRAIERPSKLPEPKIVKVEPPPNPNPNPGGKLSDADAKGLLQKKCSKCHGLEGSHTAAFFFQEGDLEKTTVLKKMLTAMKKTGAKAMPKNDLKFTSTSEGKALLTWLEQKTR